MSSPLDRIEARWLKNAEINPARFDGPRRRIAELTLREAQDVLALVNVAKAADEYVAAEEADAHALVRLLSVVTDPEVEERRRDLQKETRRAADAKYAALREALATLHKEPA